MFVATKSWSLKVAAFVSLTLVGCSSQNASSDAAAPAAISDAGTDATIAPTAIPLGGCGLNYTATVTLGGSQPFTFIVDTGSSITGVGGASCASCADGGVAPLYAPGPNATDTHTPSAESFANGTGWSGEIYSDSVSVGSAPAVNVDLVDIGSQNGFFPALDSFCGASISGIFGLGPSDLLYTGTSSYLDQLAKAGSPDIFSFQLCPASGNLWLGGFDARFAPAWTPMVSGDKFYAASMSSIAVAGQDLGLPATSFGDAFVDTGGDALWLPQATFDAVVAKIGSDANFTKLFGAATAFFKSNYTACVPLTQSPDELDAMLPPLTLTFAGGVTVQAPATSAYLMNFEGCGYAPALFTRGSNGGGLPPIELGAPILHNKLIVIDRANQRIGFAPAPCK